MRWMPHAVIRIPVFILSIITTALGIVLITRAFLGTSPISSIPFVLSFYFPYTFGQLTFVLNILFICGEIILLRSRFQLLQLFQIPVIFIFSTAIDLWMHLFSFLQNLPVFLEFCLLISGCMILGFGICIEVASQVLLVPGEGIVKAIAETGKWRLGSTKIAFDCTLCCIALVLSFIFGGLGVLTGLGIGTIISALLVGRFVNFFNAHLFFLGRLARLSLPGK